MSGINPDLLAILVCPECKTKVIEQEDKLICTNNQCGFKYPIRNGIPVMLVDEAEKPGR